MESCRSVPVALGFYTPRRVQFLCVGGSFFVEISLSSSLLAVPVKLWWSSVGIFLLLRCSPSSLVCSEPVCCRPRVYNMPPPPRSTNNSLSAGLSQDGLPSSSAASLVPTSGSAGSGPPLSADAIADAVVRALGSSLPGHLSVASRERLLASRQRCAGKLLCIADGNEC